MASTVVRVAVTAPQVSRIVVVPGASTRGRAASDCFMTTLALIIESYLREGQGSVIYPVSVVPASAEYARCGTVAAALSTVGVDPGAVRVSPTTYCYQESLESPGPVAVPAPYELVIVRGRRENISWVDAPWLRDARVVVYDKDDVDAAHFFHANIGDEAMPYLLHILESYDNLPPVIVFSQADPWSHVDSVNHLACLIEWARMHRPDYLSLSTDAIEYLSLTATGLLTAGFLKGFSDIEELRVGVEPLNPARFFVGGMFATTRDAIRARSREWWIRLYKILTSRHEKDLLLSSGHIMERHWHSILAQNPADRNFPGCSFPASFPCILPEALCNRTMPCIYHRTLDAYKACGTRVKVYRQHFKDLVPALGGSWTARGDPDPPIGTQEVAFRVYVVDEMHKVTECFADTPSATATEALHT
jgi:hypothetical protein